MLDYDDDDDEEEEEEEEEDSEMGFFVCAVYVSCSCVPRYGTSCFKSHPRWPGNVQLIPYPRGLQQK